MESNNKPPKLSTRLRMASLTAPQVIGEPDKQDYAPGFFGKRRLTAWGIGFLMAVVAALSVVIKLVQADVKNEKNSNMAAVEQREKLKASIGAVEKEKAVLKTRVAELEQKWKISAQLQAELAKARKLSAEAETGLQQATVAKTAAEKERADLQAQVGAQARHAADVMNATDQIQEELAREKQVCTESEARIAEANQARAAAAQAMIGLKQKLVEGEKQTQVLKNKVEFLTQRQAELAKARKLSAEAEAGLRQATVAKTAAERDMATLKARLEEVSQEVVTAREQAQQVRSLRDEIGREKQRHKSLLQEMAKAGEAVQAAKKKRAVLQARAAGTPAAEPFSPDLSEPKSAAATEKRIDSQARVASPSAAIELAQDADNAKTSRVFLSAGSEANRHFKAGFQKWDEGNVDGSIAEFKKTISLDSSAAVACYNIALGYVEKGDRYKACDYFYQAGEIYLKNKNNEQATRVVEFMRTIDPSSSLIEKLSKKIAQK